MNVKIWYKNLKCLGSMITMLKVHNKWQCSRDIDEVQSLFDICWQDVALRRHEVAYNILRVKFEKFYQNKKFTCEKWGYICPTLSWFYPPIGCSCLVFSKQKNFLQLDVHVWCLARKKTSSNWMSMFGVQQEKKLQFVVVPYLMGVCHMCYFTNPISIWSFCVIGLNSMTH